MKFMNAFSTVLSIILNLVLLLLFGILGYSYFFFAISSCNGQIIGPCFMKWIVYTMASAV